MPQLEFDLIQEIVKLGSRVSIGETVDPSKSGILAQAGVALVTTYIEQLSLLEIVRDPFPLFGVNGGMWIGYQLTEKGRDLSTSEDTLRRAVAELIGGPKTEVSEAIKSIQGELERTNINKLYKDDFIRTVEEVGICFDNECYIAAIGLCGKVLEVCLKEILIRNNIEFDPNSMVGSLIRLIERQAPHEYTDPALRNIVNIINTSRITAVHAREEIPVPSRDQAIMVIFATRDILARNISHINNQ